MSAKLFEESEAGDLLTEVVKLGLAPGEILLGTLIAIDSNGNPVVNFTYIDQAISSIAITTVAVTHQHIGRQAALLFANGDYQKPVITGFIYSPLHQLLENFEFKNDSDDAVTSNDEQVFDGVSITHDLAAQQNLSAETVRVDGKRVLIEGQEEVVLMCGDASITLTKAGKVVIRGKYLLSRSTGVNRILGGSVQVN